MTIAICLCTCDRPQVVAIAAGRACMALGSLGSNDIFLVVDNQHDGRAQTICDRARQAQ
jgi:hypothetical protein